MPEWPRHIDEEMRQHLDDEYRALRAAGASHDAAMRELAGDVDELSSMRRRPVDAVAGDVRFALRTLRKNPGFTAVVMLTLALGIGATTAIFSVVDAVMLRPYPYPDIDRIAVVSEVTRSGLAMSVAWPNFQDWRDQNQVFQALGVYRPMALNSSGGDRPERLSGTLASSEVFTAMGIQAQLGRTFVPGDDKPGAPRMAVVSDRFWRSHLNGDPAAVGKSITLNGEAYDIVGVMPAEMRFPSRLTDVWLPLGLYVQTFPSDRGAHPGLSAVARLRPGISVERATADMDAIARRLEQQYPMSNTDHTVSVEPYYEQIVKNIRPALLALAGAVGFVLLIGCANLANLMLARADARQREIAIREALGASRWRIAQQILTESVLMALGGGAIGAVVAWWGVKAFVASGPTSVPRVDLMAVDLRVLTFAMAVSIATGIAFGLAPALRASSIDLLTSLKEAARGAAGAGRRLRSALVVVEVALALVLLVGAGLTMRSFAALTSVDLGFDPSHVVGMRLTLPNASYPQIDRWKAFHQELVRRAASIPGVDAVGLNSSVPLEGGGNESEVIYEGQPRPQSIHEEGTTALFQASTPDYFRAMGVAQLKGRSLELRDAGNPQGVVVNRALVEHYWPGQDPLGQRIRGDNARAEVFGLVVGVVENVRQWDVGIPALPEMYFLYRRNTQPEAFLVVRSAFDAHRIVPALRRELAALDTDLALSEPATMAEIVSTEAAARRTILQLTNFFMVVTVVLTVVGIYGTLSFQTQQRTREIGVRLALGAAARDIVGLVLRQTTPWLVGGVLVGTLLSIGIAVTLRAFLADLTIVNPAYYFVGVAAIGLVLVVACWLPARRATRINPVDALRAE